MALCGSARCGCGIVGSGIIGVTGSGEPGDPFVVGTVGGTGWQLITTGTASNTATINIPVPPGEFTLLRLHMRGTITAVAQLGFRLNGVSDNNYLYGLGGLTSNNTPLAVDGEYSPNATYGRLAVWAGLSHCTLTAQFYDVGVAGQTSWLSDYGRPAGQATNTVRGQANGRMVVSPGVVSTILVRPLPGSVSFNAVRWWLEGMRTV